MDEGLSTERAQEIFLQAMSALERDGGLGLTGEIVIARRDGSDMLFLLTHGDHKGDAPLRLPLSSGSDPMQRALRGERGAMIGIDYRGRSVLAAYQPLPDLGVGLVTRMDMDEIRSPFLAAGGITLAAALILALWGAFVFRRLAIPLIHAVDERERNSRDLFDLSPFPVILIDPASLLAIDFNETANRELGYTREEFAALTMTNILGMSEGTLRDCAETSGRFDVYKPVRSNHGDFRERHIQGHVIRYRGRTAIYCTVQELSDHASKTAQLEGHRDELVKLVAALSMEIQSANTRAEQEAASRRNVEAQLRLGQAALQTSDQGVFVTDGDGTILVTNPAFSAITGYTSEEALGRNPRMLKSDHQVPEFYQRMWSTLLVEGRWSGRLWNRRKNGEAYLQQLTISVFRDEESHEPRNFIAVLSDVTELYEKDNQLQRQTQHDALTDLPNRLLFLDRLEQGITRAKRDGEIPAVLLLDLDHFKYVSETLGHPAGDNLLKAVAARLSATLPHGETVSRLGGDEFAVLTSGTRDAQSIEQVAANIIEAFERPFRIDGHELSITTSIGIAVYPSDGSDPSSLLKNADAAMYWVKKNGRNNFHFYAPQMNARALTHITLASELRRAIARQEFELHYQPLMALPNQEIIGVEALIRWRHPERGLVFPDEFIPFSEETRLVVPIGEWVLEQACRQVQAWRCDGHHVCVSVNVSARQFVHADLVKKVDAILSSTGLSSACLKLELTESLVMQQPDRAIEILKALKERGVSIAVDDFGTGYSSLSYLTRFPLDMLKIDKSFIRDMAHDPATAAITETIVALGRALGMTVLAEGVETHEQLQMLRDMGCDAFQGYFVSRPLPPEPLRALLDANSVEPLMGTAGVRG
jgi:diguanylate cyclase (GGDEF)-like protein/PAS domain S-box-containing protein